MKEFVITFYGGGKDCKKSDEKCSEEEMQKLKSWADSLGDAVVAPVVYFADYTKVATDKGVFEDPDKDTIDGYMVIRADSMNAAVDLVRENPYLNIVKDEGYLRVSEIMIC